MGPFPALSHLPPISKQLHRKTSERSFLHCFPKTKELREVHPRSRHPSYMPTPLSKDFQTISSVSHEWHSSYIPRQMSKELDTPTAEAHKGNSPTPEVLSNAYLTWMEQAFNSKSNTVNMLRHVVKTTPTPL